MSSPTALLEARGSFKAHPERRRTNEPQAGGVGPPPKSLKPDESAIWDRTVSEVAPGVFQSGDRAALTAFCRLVAESERDWSKFSSRKLTVLLQFFGRFGMTPSDRAKIHVPKKPPKNGEAVGLAKYVS